MAMQTGISSSKVLILVGAGLTGSVILRNGRISDVLADLQELIKGANQVEISPGHYDVSLLAAQIRNLAQEVKELAVSRPVTIYNGESSGSGSLASYIMPAAAIGAMGYCYMWWKGWSFSDVMFVTKQSMVAAVDNVSKQLEQVSAALAVTKRHLTERLEGLDGKLDEQKETSRLIMNEVKDASAELSKIGFDIESIQKMFSCLEGRMEHIENKQDMTNRGIYYLCQVAGGIKDGLNTNFFQEASSKPQLISHSTPTFTEVEPIQGLQFLAGSPNPGKLEQVVKTNTLSLKDVNEKPPNTPVTKTTTLHRSSLSGISINKAGFVL